MSVVTAEWVDFQAQPPHWAGVKLTIRLTWREALTMAAARDFPEAATDQALLSMLALGGNIARASIRPAPGEDTDDEDAVILMRSDVVDALALFDVMARLVGTTTLADYERFNVVPMRLRAALGLTSPQG